MRRYDHNRRSTRDGDVVLRRPESAGDGRGCFADEIALDFPSVTALVCRMRERFFGVESSARRMRAHIVLSRFEAQHGTSASLELVLPATCDECGGRGETWNEWCLVCRGSGRCERRHALTVPVPAGVRDGARYRVEVDRPHDAAVLVDVAISVR